MSAFQLDRGSAYIPDVVPDSDLAMYRKANFGHPIGWGRKIAIVVVDMTRAFVEDRFAKMVPFRNRTEAGRWYDSCPGIFGHADDPAAHDSAEIPPDIAPRADEAVIVKGKPRRAGNGG